MATFRTYAEVLGPDHPLMKNKARSVGWSYSRYRSADVDQAMRAEPGVVLGDVLRQAGGAYETATRLTPRFREDIRETAELTSDGEVLRIAGLPQVRVSLEHLRQVDPQTRILVGYRLDVSLHESPRLSRRLALRLIPGSRCISTRSCFRALREDSGALCAGIRPACKRAIVQQSHTTEISDGAADQLRPLGCLRRTVAARCLPLVLRVFGRFTVWAGGARLAQVRREGVVSRRQYVARGVPGGYRAPGTGQRSATPPSAASSARPATSHVT
jgi:hypothetical protein